MATRLLPLVPFLALCLLHVGPSLAPAQQFQVVGKRHMPVSANDTGAVVAGDIDGDGDTDLIFAQISGFNMQYTLFVNDGRAGFREATRTHLPPIHDITRDLKLVDVDGDRDLDLLAAIQGHDRLLLNDGRGRFKDVTFTHMPLFNSTTTGLAVGDVDGDGDPDLATGARTFAPERLLLNNGSGKFVDATSTHMPKTVPDVTEDLAFVDVDRDGDLDLVIANYGQQNRLLLNGGSGRFTDATQGRLPVKGGRTTSIASGDVDRDGDQDLVFGDRFPKQNTLLLNDGKGQFRPDSTGMLPKTDGTTQDVVLADVDRDGDLDLVVGNRELPGAIVPQNQLYLNRGKGRFDDTTSKALPRLVDNTMSLAVADLDGDSDVDVVTGNAEFYQRNDLLLNDGGGAFVLGTAFSVPRLSRIDQVIAAGDLDGDGLSDPVNVLQDGARTSIVVLIGDRRGSFRESFRIQGMSGAAVLLDLEGDGDPDLVCDRGPVNALRNEGQGRFVDVTSAVFPGGFISASGGLWPADFDGDGDIDLAGIERMTSRLALFLNDGRGVLRAGGRIPQIGNVHTGASADIEGDGDVDLVVSGTQVRLLANDGKAQFTDVTTGRVPKTPAGRFILPGDVDRDRDVDLILQGLPARLLLNDGKGSFKDATTGRIPKGPAGDSLLLGDVDLDGDPDLFGVASPRRPYVYINDGAATFRDHSAQRVAPRWPPQAMFRAVALADFDADGDPDVLMADTAGPFLLHNLHRQVDAPLHAQVGRPYRLDLYVEAGYAIGNRYLIPLVSIAEKRIRVPPYGTLGLDPARMAILDVMSTRRLDGKVSTLFYVPRDPVLRGARVVSQALVIGSASNPVQEWRLTNVVSDPVLF